MCVYVCVHTHTVHSMTDTLPPTALEKPQATESLATIFISGKNGRRRRIIFLLALGSVKTQYPVSVDTT